MAKKKAAEFGQRLAEAIADAGVSVSEFQRRMETRSKMYPTRKFGYAYPTIMGYLHHGKIPSLEWVTEAADVLGVRLRWLQHGEEPKRMTHRLHPALRARLEKLKETGFFKTEEEFAQFSEELEAQTAVSDLLPMTSGLDSHVEDMLRETVGRLRAKWELGEGAQNRQRRYVDDIATVAKAISVQLETLGIDPDRLTRDQLEGYFAGVCCGLQHLSR